MPKRGGSRGRKRASLYDLSRDSLRPEHQDEYVKELNGESDRAAALVAAADVDYWLIMLLRSKLSYKLTDIERNDLLYGKRAPLSDFSARISIAYGFGLIHSDERDDLNRIRHIRNAFAHAVISLTFEHELIAKECAHLAHRDVYGDTSDSFGKPKLRYILTALELRKVFAERIIAGARGYAKTIKDRARRRQYLDEIERILKPDT